jgi:hypothetical protein
MWNLSRCHNNNEPWGRKIIRGREEKEEGKGRSRSKQGIRRVKSDKGTLYDVRVNYY